MTVAPSPLRLLLDGDALAANWRWLARQSGSAACGAAIKANGYGLGAVEVQHRLMDAGCRDFFVATWAEALALPVSAGLSVLHGVRGADMAAAVASQARPVLNTVDQVALWRSTGLPCDVMIDTGINRLGLSEQDIADGVLIGLQIDTLMSHFACADEDSEMNQRQLASLLSLTDKVAHRRMSIANSAGILVDRAAALSLTRPGLALYGGIPRREATGHIAQVVFPQAQIIQRRHVPKGQTVGYGATYTAAHDTEIAILNIGYADGYLRTFSGGAAGQGCFPVVGRVSMDLLAICVDADPALKEGDWIDIDYDLPQASSVSGLSQYELLTGLGSRFDRIWS